MDNQDSISSYSNSYLKETDYNSDIESDIRREIDYKFLSSKTNSKYVFPRVFKQVKKFKIIKKKPSIKNNQVRTSKKIQSLNNSILCQKKVLPSITSTHPVEKKRNLSFKIRHVKNM